MQWLGLNWQGRNVSQVCRWLQRRNANLSSEDMWVWLLCRPQFYKIWMNRSLACCDSTVHTIDHIVKEIQYNVKNRILQILSSELTG